MIGFKKVNFISAFQTYKQVRLLSIGSTNSFEFGHDVESRERARAVASFYNQSAIEIESEKPSIRLTPSSVLYGGRAGNEADLIQSAKYLYREMPVRLAHRIKSFHSLPFIIGCNPTILSVHDLYIRSFHTLHDYPQIRDMKDVERFAKLLQNLLDDHSDVVTNLAEGFRQCAKHLKNEDIGTRMVRRFLDRMLASRLGIRLLAMHNILLHDKTENHIGMINTKFCPTKPIEHWTIFARRLCEYHYGKAPVVRVSGHIHAHFPYFPLVLDYIIPELLKNSMRATMEFNNNPSSVPDVIVTIANNHEDFVIRVSDRGGGIPHKIVDRVLEYNFTTVDDENPSTTTTDNNPLGDMMGMANNGPDGKGLMHGYGFGLPVSRCYANHLGGNLSIESMQGIGTDVYLRLRHIDGNETFRI